MQRTNWLVLLGAAAAMFALWAGDAVAQYQQGIDMGRGGGRWREDRRFPDRDIFPGNTFTFCRLQYDTGYGGRGWGRRGGGKWATDWPDSDENFSTRLAEVTTLNVEIAENGRPKTAIVRATDPELYHYPFLYMIEVGGINLSEVEAAKLREYVLRGGFIMVDDFWGQDEWESWVYAFHQIFPDGDYAMVDIPLDHPIYHVVFDIKEVPQVPSINAWRSGYVSEVRGGQASIKGVSDKKGRLMMVICHNTDLGDGWEREAENHGYFEEISVKKAYPMGINIVVYAMTH